MAASLTASGRSQTVTGEVCVSVTDIFAAYVMPHIVRDLRRLAPQIRLKVLASNDISDLQRREADIAVRHVAPTQADLIAKKVRECDGWLYASKEYLKSFGPIKTLKDAARADYIAIGSTEENYAFLHKWGIEVSHENFIVMGDGGGTGWEMCRQGIGLSPMTEDIAVMFPEIERILPQLDPVPVPYWLTTHRELHSSKKIRLVYDFIAEALSRPDLPGAGASRSR